MAEQITQLKTFQPDLPASVRAAYGMSDHVIVDYLSSGSVNQTMLVHDRGELTVMRRLAPVHTASLLEDTHAMGGHLISRGWEAPQNLPTTDGALHTSDSEGYLWHRIPYIESDSGIPQRLDNDVAASIGQLLGRWHLDMQGFDYELKFSLPHHHDTAYHAAKLTSHLADMPNARTHSLASELLRRYRLMPEQNTEPKQIIHGDPKLDNILFRGGVAHTLIDFDDTMKASKWIDVGDALRSLSGKLLLSDRITDEPEAFVYAYRETNELDLSADEAMQRAYKATGQIALELSMRYLSDIVDKEEYFSWDPNKHDSRAGNHTERAELNLEVVKYALAAA